MAVRRETLYFEEPGGANTELVVEAVTKRIEEGGVDAVVVASNMGYVAKKVAERLGGKVPVVSVSEFEYKPKTAKALKKLGVKLVEKCSLPIHGKRDVRETLYTFGHGLKAAVEVALAAVEAGAVEPGSVVLAVGGKEKGADTAVVLRVSRVEEMFSEDPEKRLEVREIVAMPLRK